MAGQGNRQLTLCEAADHLAVTPELLLAFARKSVRGSDQLWRLASIERDGRRWFEVAELDRFSLQLQAPWCAKDAKRPAIPTPITRLLSVECLGICPRCKAGGSLDMAHIVEFETTRNHHPHNLIRLCKACHTDYDEGLIELQTIKDLKAQLQQRLRGLLRQIVTDEALKPPEPAPGFSGRDKELADLRQALGESTSVLISGVGGQGKTQALLQAMRGQETGRPIFWFAVEHYGSTDELRGALAALAARLGATRDDSAIAALDAARACLVFDGVESLGGDFDGLNDFLAEILGGMVAGQLVVTSQATFPALDFEHHTPLGRLSGATARKILTGDDPEEDKDALIDLLAFADGHALTLRILRALIRYFDGAREVAGRVRDQGARALAMPARQVQNRQTSLDLSLSLAISQLGIDELRLLFMVSLCPAGIFAPLIPTKRVDLVDRDASAAELTRWDLLQIETSGPIRLLSTLSPVRHFATGWFRVNAVADTAKLQLELGRSLIAHIIAIQERYIRKDRERVGMSLLERDFPNFAAAFDRAEKSRAIEERELVSGFASRLMEFLFTSGRFDYGVDLMMRTAKVEVGLGEIEGAIASYLQAQSLAERAGDEAAATRALAAARALPLQGSDVAQAMIWSMEASEAEREGRYPDVARLAGRAHALFVSDASCAPLATSMLFMQAGALEHTHRAGEALHLYRTALETAEQRGDGINRGSCLHHMGNCLGTLGRPVEAFDCYAKAVAQFVEIGAVEFISNAFGGAGDLLRDLPGDFDPSVQFDEAKISAGLQDAVAHLARRLSPAAAFDRADAIGNLRTLGNAAWLAATTPSRSELAAIADALEALIGPSRSTAPPKDEFEAYIFQLISLGALMRRLASTDDETTATNEEVGDLANACGSAFAGVHAAEMFASLASYLARRRGRVIAPEDLQAFQSRGRTTAPV